MGFIAIYFYGFVLIFITMLLLWLLSLAIKDASIVDIFWGSGFVLVGGFYFLITSGFETRKILIMFLVALWGLRLTLHLAKRNLGKGEDYRYQKWREEAGESWWWQSFLRVFLLQGVIMWLVSIPLLGAQISSMPNELTWLDYSATLIWLIGFVFEAVGDWQLMQFRADDSKSGQVLNTGLWRYTRHPNYFGDAMQWWGFYLFALAAGAWWTIFSPLLMTFFLMRVSGVTLLEHSLKKRKPDYQEYIKRTSAFFPMPPKRN